MTNYIISGCFDIWHEGHASLFKNLFTLCKNDKDFYRLVVYMNSDKSVKKLKGGERPINTYEERKRKVLEETRKLDIRDDKGGSFITMFRECRKTDIVHELERWDSESLIYVNSHEKLILDKRPIEIDYCIEKGIKMIFLPYIKGYSTTRIIEERRKDD